MRVWRPSWPAARITCCGPSCDDLVDGYFPVLRQARRRDRRARGRGHRKHGTPWILERLFDVRRDLLMIRHAVSPQREIFNQLTNRDLALITARAGRLLPRRLRPPHPADRRARHLPRARQRRPSTSTSRRSTTTCPLIMKRLTGVTVDSGQHRRLRRHLRHERGRGGLRRDRGRPDSGWSRHRSSRSRSSWPTCSVGSAGSDRVPFEPVAAWTGASGPGYWQKTGSAFGWASR